ncbi:MAG: ABC transporter substrate-binding protein [Xanthobacteraceae bacterium]
MQRRQFITVIGGVAAASTFSHVAVRAQQTRMRRIGMLSALSEHDPEGQARLTAFQQGLQQLGWKIGENVRIDHRWAGGSADRLRVLAAELVRSKPDVILAAATSALAPLRRETRTIPLVFAQVSDPVALGFVASLARPGGNITGFATSEHGLAVKWLELLKQIAPSIARVGVIYQPALPQTAGYLHEIEAGAPSLKVQVSTAAVRDRTEIERAIATFAREPNCGLIMPPGPVLATHRDAIIGLAAQRRLPAVYPYRFFVTSGGLASYGIDNHDLYRRAAGYVDRILRGENPAELPVQHPTKFELVINLKTAKALGLDPPMALLARTDEVIE